MEQDLSTLNLVELYDLLIEAEAPVPVSLWPQTAGWIWVLGAVVLLAAIAVWKWVAWRRATAYRRAALAALDAAGDDPAAIADILRRTALAGFPRRQVAGLHGARWLAFLDETGSNTGFSDSDAGRVLVTGPFKPQAPDARLPVMAAEWIKTHRAPMGSP